MKKISALAAVVFVCSGIALLYLVPERAFSEQSPYQITAQNKDQKKILIFSCKGGGGHVSAARALTEYLQNDFCVGTTYVFSNILQTVDFISKFYPQDKTAVDSYNYLAQRGWHWFINTISQIGVRYFALRKRTINAILETYIITHKPDLLISVAPVVNKNLLKVAKKLAIPFLLIPTDLDGTNTIFGIANPTYDKFRLGLSYEDPAITQKITENNLDKKYISYIGFPVKSSFFTPHNQQATRTIFGVPEGRPVILLMMGSQGSDALYEFSKQIAKLTIPVHLVIVLGKSNRLAPQLRNVQFPKHISHTLLGFTDHIPELMGIADLLITKSGSVTVNEDIYAQVPLLLDATTTVLQWEHFNHSFIEKHGLGKVVKQTYQIPGIITKMLRKEEQDRIRSHFEMFTKKNPEQEVKLLVRQMI